MSKLTKLEKYIAEKLKKIDKYARPTKASGASTEIGDIYSKIAYCECKERNTKNLTIDIKVWDKLLNSIPPHQAHKKITFLAMSNKDDRGFVIMNIPDFFDILYELYTLRRFV